MTRILGVLGLLIALYAILIGSDPAAGKVDNLIDVANIQGSYGVITLGAALVIIIGGIDLSIGSVLGCGAILFGTLMTSGVPPVLAMFLVLGFGMVVGLTNGVLITQLKLQPFLVTLCGMFVYRGMARLLGGEVGRSRSVEAHPEFLQSLQNLRYLLIGKDSLGALVFPAQFILLLLLAAILGFFLHRTAYGRYWYAIGHNELAAKYAGVRVDRQRVTLAAFAGVLLFLDMPSVKSDSGGTSKELYAILGAVLGGCSLRGGEGTAFGMVLGAMVLPVLENLVSFRGLESNVIPAVIGLTLLFGTIVDELIRRRSRVNR
jgi:ribose transport system permease protein